LRVNSCTEHRWHQLQAVGCEGAPVAVHAQGRVTLPFYSEGMDRGFADGGGSPVGGIDRASA